MPTIRTDLKLAIAGILKTDRGNKLTMNDQNLRKDIDVAYVKEKKTKKLEQCPSSDRPMCDDHRAYLRNDCAGQG